MKELEELKDEVKLTIKETANWIYGEKGDCAGEAAEDLAGEIEPVIEKNIEEAFKIGFKKGFIRRKASGKTKTKGKI